VVVVVVVFKGTVEITVVTGVEVFVGTKVDIGNGVVKAELTEVTEERVVDEELGVAGMVVDVGVLVVEVEVIVHVPAIEGTAFGPEPTPTSSEPHSSATLLAIWISRLSQSKTT
jgi:hypothetical protein